jgi:hypothetical protein
MKRINTRKELMELASALGVRSDWHEPDEQDLTTVELRGNNFDNAGFWPEHRACYDKDKDIVLMEQFIIIRKKQDADIVSVACINVANLLAWACHE